MGLKSIHEAQKQSSKQESNLIELIEEQRNRIAELEEMRQQLLSEKQELASMLQEQMKKIAEQSEQIVKLNGSDLVLQENEKLKKLNEKLKQEASQEKERADSEAMKAMRQISICESECEEKLEQQQEALRASLSEEKQKYDKMYQYRKNELESDYKALRRRCRIWLIKFATVAVLFFLVLTVCQSCKSKAIMESKQLQTKLKGLAEADWYVCSSPAIVYQQHDTGYSVSMLSVYPNKVVQAKDTEAEWVYIQSGNKTGYIKQTDFQQYFSEVKIDINLN